MDKGFIWYPSFYESIKNLDVETFKECASALMEYGLYGVVPENLSPMAQMYFISNKPQLDANLERRVNGNKGGRPKKTIGFENENHRLLNDKPKDKDKEKDKDKDKDKDKEKVNTIEMGKFYSVNKKTQQDVLNELDELLKKEVSNG